MRSSGYEVRTGCPDASAGASLKLRDVTSRLPGKAESERGRQTSGQRFGGQREPSGSQQMILQKPVVERCDVNFGGVASIQTAGLPFWKRVLDLALIVVVLPGLLILGVGTALVVLCGSRGPVFFRQRRVGYKGREFTCRSEEHTSELQSLRHLV